MGKTTLEENIIKANRQYHLFEKGDGIVIGLSGGPDSLALVNALFEMKEAYELKLCAVHVNHMYRADADADQAFVEAFCKTHDIPCYVFKRPVEQMSIQDKKSFEEMGREVRYDAFEEIRAKLNFDKIAVAQNKNDVVETFFINAFRGSGIEGLRSIEYKRGPYIIRPLLSTERKDIEAYCIEKHLNPKIDHTNNSLDYTRNRIRNELLPYIREHFNENIVNTIYRTTENLKSDNEFLKKKSFEIFTKMRKEDQIGKYIRIDAFSDLHSSMKARVILFMIKEVRGHSKNISQKDIHKLMGFQSNNKIHWLDNQYCVYTVYNHMYFLSKAEKDAINQRQPKQKIVMQEMTIQAYNHLKGKANTNRMICIDAEKVFGEISIRNRKPGDKFHPLGMKGSKKIKDYMMDMKIPVHKRDSILIVEDELNIIWVAGYRMSERYKVSEKTYKVIVMNLVDEL